MNTTNLRLIASSLRDGASHWHEQDSAVQINHAADEIDALRSELDRLRAAAERYRVARTKVCIVGDSFHVINLRPTYVAPDAAIEFDAAIDAAIARGKE